MMTPLHLSSVTMAIFLSLVNSQVDMGATNKVFKWVEVGMFVASLSFVMLQAWFNIYNVTLESV